MREKKSILTDILMLAACFLIAYPFLYIIMGSLKSRAEFAKNPFGIPKTLMFSNFVTAFEGVSFLRILMNNIIIAACSVAIVTLVSAMAAYAIVYHSTKLNRTLRIYLMLGFFIPFQATLLPLYQIYARLGLMDTLHGLILLHAGSVSLAFSMFYGGIVSLPKDLVEAGWLDGCGVGKTFLKIVFPLTKPVMITVVIFTFFAVWNDYLGPSLFLTSRDKGVLILEVTRAVTKNVIDWGRAFAVVTITLILPFLFFLFSQKYLVKGMVAGGVKG